MKGGAGRSSPEGPAAKKGDVVIINILRAATYTGFFGEIANKGLGPVGDAETQISHTWQASERA